MATSIFKLVGSIFVENGEANKNIDQTGKKAEGLASKFKSGAKTVAKWGAGIAAAAGTAGGAMLAMAKKSAENLDEIQKGAQKLGMSYEAYQKLSYAADRSGTSIEKLSKGMKNVTNVITGMVEEDSKAAEALDALGVATQSASGEMRSADDVMMEALLALADMEDITKRNALANQIFGTSYQDLQPLLNNGSEGIKDLMQNAEDLGLVMSNEAVDGGAKFKDQLDDVTASLGSVTTNIGAELMPAVSEILQWVISHMPEIKETVATVFDYVSKFFEEIKPLLIAVKDLVVDVVWPAIKAIIDSGVLELFLNGAKEGIEYLKSALETLGGAVKMLTGDWKGGWDSIKNNFGPVVEHLMSTFNPLYALVKAIRDTIEWINGQNVSEVAGKYAPESGRRFGIETPLMATGGTITSSGMAIVGEAGAELINMPKGATVTPLNDNNNAFSDMSKKLDTLNETMKELASMGIYINGNALVGQMAPGMDKTLGSFSRRAARSV